TVATKEDLRQILTDSASSRLMASGQYTVVQFHKTLPTVARLHLDLQLSDSDISEPYAEDNVKGAKVTKAAGYDYAFLGSVDDYQWNDATKSVDLVVSGRLLDTKTNKMVGTPVTLKASSGTGGNAKEPARAMEAARNAGAALMQKLVPITGNGGIAPPAEKPKVASAPKKKKNNDVLWGLLAVGLGLGIGLASSGGHHGGSSGGGGGGDTPPAPP
ncbi:MAG: hypothetical protein ABJA67_17375, partial [Chthonomonadales bacterium]